MAYDIIPIRTTIGHLKKTIDTYLPKSPAYIDYGECFGKMTESSIKIYVKKPSRSIKILAFDYLFAEVSKDGYIKYCYKRTIESLIMTVLAPLFIIFVGCLLGGLVLQIQSMFLGIIPAIILSLCNFIIPRRLHQDLLDKLLQLIELSQTVQSKL